MHILIDFDSTLVDTSKAYFDYYQEQTKDYSTEYSEDKVSWNMTNLCKLWSSQEQVDNVYIQEGLFKHFKLFPNVLEVLNKLKQEGHYLHVVSCHDVRGMRYKIDWIKENLPIIDEITIIPIESGIQKFDKSSVKGDLIIDDKLDCHETSNTKYNLLYGLYPWNKGCDKYDRVMNWNEVYEYISNISKLDKSNGIDVDKFREYYNCKLNKEGEYNEQ